MIEKLKDNRALITRILLCVMTVFLVAGAFVMHGFADDKHEDDFSFYRVASAAASYYDQTHNDKKGNKIDITKFAKDGATISDYANIGVAGNLVGFVDEDYSKGFFGATVSKLSASSQSRSYMSFRDNEKALLAYVQYGHALQMLGLDSTANTSLNISFIIRGIAGMLLILAYSLAVMVSLLFKAILTMLQSLNPFAWFLGSDAVKVPFHDWFSNASGHMPIAFSGIQKLVSTLYAAMSKLGIVLIPIFFVMLVASIILFRTGRGGMGDSVWTKIRKYITRVVFILAGIPILGASYTACLDALLSGNDADAFSVSTSAANDVIGSTLVDFETWAVNKRLALPANVKITIDGTTTVGSSIDTSKTSDLRQMARNINAMANWRLTRSTSKVSAMNGVAIDVGDSSSSNNEPSVLAAYDVMFRYMLSTYYKASDLETQYKSSMAGKTVSGGKSYGTFWGWLTGVEKEAPDSLMDYIESDAQVKNYSDKNKLAGKDGAGPYMYDNKTGGISVAESHGSFTYSGNGTKGLSTLAMYNYLTSEFSGSSVINYSNNKVAALVMSHAHRSVSAIGGGAVRTLYVLYAIIMLFVMAIIGFGYALAVMFGMFRHGISMVMSTPFALMGNFRAMSKVTTIVAMMIIELIGTVFMYQIVIYFLTHILDIFMVPVYDVLNKKPSTIVSIMNAIGIPAASTSSFGGQALQIGVISLAIIMLVVFAFKAMKLRKSFVKTMEEMAANTIDRIFSPGGTGAGGAGAAYANRPTLGDKVANGAKHVAGAAGTGLAMAGANNLMQGKPLFGGLSKGDAALAGGPAEDGTAKGDEAHLGNNGIEGGDQQGIPGPKDPNNPGGSPRLTGAGGSSEEKVGQKLIGGQSLDDNSNKNVDRDGGASVGSAGVMDMKTAELAAVQPGQTLSEAGARGANPVAKATGQVSAMNGERMADAKDTAQQTISGAAEAAYVGTQTGNTKLAAEGAQQTISGAQKAKAGISQRANAEQLAVQQTADSRVAPKSMQDSQRMVASMSRSQLANVSQSYGSKRSGSMGMNEARATVAAAQSVEKQYGLQHAGQRLVQMSEGVTKSKQYLNQAKQYNVAAQKMYAAVKAAPTASSYTFGGVTYDKAGMIAGARKYEYEAALREQVVKLRQERAVAAKLDAQQARMVRKTTAKVLSSKKSDGYL